MHALPDNGSANHPTGANKTNKNNRKTKILVYAFDKT